MDKLTPVAELTDGASVQLAGHSYIMPPAPFGALKRHSRELAAFDGQQLTPENGTRIAEIQLSLITSALKRNYPDVTQEWVEDAIGIEQVRPLYLVAMNTAGLNEQGADQEQGGEPLGESTGISSSRAS